MRKLARIIDPEDFPLQFYGENRVRWELDLLNEFRRFRRKEIDKINFDNKSSRWKHAKSYLVKESLDKCAYCECYFKTVAYGDVEHYRPKSKYWWLAYSYHNYSASCQLCNQKFKKAKFPNSQNTFKAPLVKRNNTDNYLQNLAGRLSVDPLDDDSGLHYIDFVAKHNLERPLSIDPYIDDPGNYFAYENNDVSREVLIVGLNPNVERVARSAINLFGLNRKELRDLRYRGLIKYRLIRQVAETSQNSTLMQAATNILEAEHYHPKVEFLGMYDYYKKIPLIPV